MLAAAAAVTASTRRTFLLSPGEQSLAAGDYAMDLPRPQVATVSTRSTARGQDAGPRRAHAAWRSRRRRRRRVHPGAGDRRGGRPGAPNLPRTRARGAPRIRSTAT